jgi:bacillolysin
MKSTKYIFHLLVFLFVFSSGFSQNQSVNSRKEIIRQADNSRIPSYYQLATSDVVSEDQFISWLRSKFDINTQLDFQVVKTEKDLLGLHKTQYIQSYNQCPIEFSRYSSLSRNSQILSAFGNAFDQVKISNTKILTESEALQYALDIIEASQYKWELPEEEALLKDFLQDTEASYFPKGQLVLINPEQDFCSNQLRYAWKFNIYAHEPLSRANYYVDAQTGRILMINSILHDGDVPGTAVTKLSGTQSITTDSTGPSSYRLREVGRGNGVETYNLQNGTNYGNAVDFTDDDNYWNNVNAQKDEIATDAHWGTEMTYDYYYLKHNRNSIDANGFKLRSYLHYSNNYANAFWNGSWMTYGDGNGSTEAFIALDIIGHEITHGLTSYSANLIYALESGAINEGFSDIFGNMIERYAKPSSFSWQMGEDIGYALRDMSNPNAKGDPDTYEGLYWIDTKNCVPTDNNDYCGVHTNMTVMSYWFYLLVEGGSGNNDHGKSYAVSGIGADKAEAIAFRSLTVYLDESSDFMDARFYTARSAADLYGECSNEVEAVLDAWYAVGVGNEGRSVDFVADKTSSCYYPFEVNFKNKSDAFTTYDWYFGDGDSSQNYDASHVYDQVGTYSVKLVANSICGSDSITKTDFIVVDTNMPCIFTMPTNGFPQTVDLCKGKLFDDGGTENYTGNLDAVFTIAPTGASSITLNFISFAFEGDCDCDWVYIYDGPTTNSPLIGKYSGFELPNGGSITSTGGAITIRQYTDPLQTYSGFELNWYCSNPTLAPDVDFSVSIPNSCNGQAYYTSLCTNGPHSWYWDFGDGQTSTLENPMHAYKESGTYTVMLKAGNDIGSDSLVKQNYVVIDRPDMPVGHDFESCGAAEASLTAEGAGSLKWFESAESDSVIHTGDSLYLGTISKSTSYYVMSDFTQQLKYGGAADNSIGSGRYFTGDQALVFDVHKTCILKSVKVYANGEKSRTIQLRDEAGNILQQKNILIPDGESRIDLDFLIEPANNYRLGTTTNPDLYRNSNGPSYPYYIDSLITITGSTASQPGYYYYFYNWEVAEPACFSARKKVNVWIDEPAQSSFSYQQSENKSIHFTNTSLHARVFEWSFGDGEKSTLENPVHIYSSDGHYNVQLKAANACGADSSSQQIQITTGLNEAFENMLLLYPNPVHQQLNLSYPNPERLEHHLEIISMHGKCVYRQAFTHTDYLNVKIDVKSFAKGLYFVKLTSNKRVLTKQIVVN